MRLLSIDGDIEQSRVSSCVYCIVQQNKINSTVGICEYLRRLLYVNPVLPGVKAERGAKLKSFQLACEKVSVRTLHGITTQLKFDRLIRKIEDTKDFIFIPDSCESKNIFFI